LEKVRTQRRRKKNINVEPCKLSKKPKRKRHIKEDCETTGNFPQSYPLRQKRNYGKEKRRKRNVQLKKNHLLTENHTAQKGTRNVGRDRGEESGMGNYEKKKVEETCLKKKQE